MVGSRNRNDVTLSEEKVRREGLPKPRQKAFSSRRSCVRDVGLEGGRVKSFVNLGTPRLDNGLS